MDPLRKLVEEMTAAADSWVNGGTEGVDRTELAEAVTELSRMWQDIDGWHDWPWERREDVDEAAEHAKDMREMRERTQR